MGVGTLRRYHTQEPEHVNGPGDVEASEEAQAVDDQGVDDPGNAAERPGDDQSTPFDPTAEPGQGDAAETVEHTDQPAGNASTDEWRSYAVSQGVPSDEADGLSRDELRDRYAS